ncbi:MAG: hypothetical protein R2724_17915 [Bryobacterales bacterium]
MRRRRAPHLDQRRHLLWCSQPPPVEIGKRALRLGRICGSLGVGLPVRLGGGKVERPLGFERA